MKKLIILLLCGVICVTVCKKEQIIASGAEGDYTWKLLDNGTLIINGEGPMLNYNWGLHPPPWVEYRNEVTKVIIGEKISTIGDCAFSECNNLTSITIPNSVTSIGEHAFSGCRSLMSITIPYSVTSVRYDAFIGCISFLSFDVDKSNNAYSSEDGVLLNKTKTILKLYPLGKKGSYTIPNSVESIGYCAFMNCSGLTFITISNSVTSIEDYAFLRCSGLTSISIPNSVISIGFHSFARCTSLKSIKIPNSLTDIGEFAFSYCNELTEFINESVTPQKILRDVFTVTEISACTLRVPEVSLDDYRNAPVWKEFGNIVAIK